MAGKLINMVDFLSTDDLVRISLRLSHSDRRLMGSIIDRRCAAVFVVKLKFCVLIRLYLGERVPQGTKPKHLFWGLAFLKLYEVEETFSTRVQADEKNMLQVDQGNGQCLECFQFGKFKNILLECADLFTR